MPPQDPMQPRCGARLRPPRTGTCKAYPLPGQRRCRMHGGSSPQALAKARQRLLEAVDPVAARLVQVAKGELRVAVTTKDGVVELPPSPGVQLRAMEAIMDRAGLPAAKAVELTGVVGKPIEFRVVMPKDEEDDGS